MLEQSAQCLLVASRSSDEMVLSTTIHLDPIWCEKFFAQIAHEVTKQEVVIGSEIKTAALLSTIEAEIQKRFSGYEINSVVPEAIKGSVSVGDMVCLEIHSHGRDNILGLVIHLTKDEEEIFRAHASLSSRESVDEVL